jgi:hypothetical protein
VAYGPNLVRAPGAARPIDHRAVKTFALFNFCARTSHPNAKPSASPRVDAITMPPRDTSTTVAEPFCRYAPCRKYRVVIPFDGTLTFGPSVREPGRPGRRGLDAMPHLRQPVPGSVFAFGEYT